MLFKNLSAWNLSPDFQINTWYWNDNQEPHFFKEKEKCMIMSIGKFSLKPKKKKKKPKEMKKSLAHVERMHSNMALGTTWF